MGGVYKGYVFSNFDPSKVKSTKIGNLKVKHIKISVIIL